MTANKIFCFSFQKTGTTSLHDFLIKAGFKSAHGLATLDEVDYKKSLADAGRDLDRITDAIMPYLESFDAFCDVPFGGLYGPIAERFPGAKFVLITRNLDEWWQSLSVQWSLPLLTHKLTPMELVQYSPYLGFGKATATQHDREILVEAHRQHVISVRARLANSDFLTFDLADADKSAKLAEFLGLDRPPSFPHSKPTNIRRAARRFLKNFSREPS
jgi:hypothetical protein